MRVDLYTDASIVRGVGAWAVVVPGGAGDPFEKSGRLRGKFRSSCATEICAIANGLHAARVAKLLPRNSTVRVWCDNTAAVYWANGLCKFKSSSDPVTMNARRYIRDFGKRHHLAIRAYHIKGHQRLDTDDAQAIFNMRADQLCSAERDGVEPPTYASLVERVERARRRAAA